MTQDVCMLPPKILLCEEMDTPDMQYIDSNFAPVNQPFKDRLDIESYNLYWYDDRPPSRSPTFIGDSHIPPVSPITIKPLSEHFQWNEELSNWVKNGCNNHYIISIATND